MLDIIIIGSGPAGLSAGIYAKRANRKVLIIEKEYEGTGQVAESGQVDNYPGIPGIGGYELGEKFREHALSLGVEFVEAEVTGIQQLPDSSWQVFLENKSSLLAKSVIYAAGASHRKLDIPGEAEFSGKGVSYCAICDGALYRGKAAAVIGGGDTALDDALYLSDICEKVYLVHRREEFRGADSTVSLIKEKANIELVLNARPAEISGQGKVSELTLQDGRLLAVNGIFAAIGMVPKTEILQGLIDLDEQGYVIADETGATNRKGFFVAGDVRTKELRQVVTAVSDGANAVTSADTYIRKNWK